LKVKGLEKTALSHNYLGLKGLGKIYRRTDFQINTGLTQAAIDEDLWKAESGGMVPQRLISGLKEETWRKEG